MVTVHILPKIKHVLSGLPYRLIWVWAKCILLLKLCRCVVSDEAQLAFRGTGSHTLTHRADLTRWVRISEICVSEPRERGHPVINSTISDARLPGFSPSTIPFTAVWPWKSDLTSLFLFSHLENVPDDLTYLQVMGRVKWLMHEKCLRRAEHIVNSQNSELFP